jgi:hypothetical protein
MTPLLPRVATFTVDAIAQAREPDLHWRRAWRASATGAHK